MNSVIQNMNAVRYRLDADGRTLLPDYSEQQTIQKIVAIRQGGRSMREIAEQLNEVGLRTRCGSDWRFEYVRRVLKRSTVDAA